MPPGHCNQAVASWQQVHLVSLKSQPLMADTVRKFVRPAGSNAAHYNPSCQAGTGTPGPQFSRSATKQVLTVASCYMQRGKWPVGMLYCHNCILYRLTSAGPVTQLHTAASS